jgi:hypothetical protein
MVINITGILITGGVKHRKNRMISGHIISDDIHAIINAPNGTCCPRHLIYIGLGGLQGLYFLSRLFSSRATTIDLITKNITGMLNRNKGAPIIATHIAVINIDGSRKKNSSTPITTYIILPPYLECIEFLQSLYSVGRIVAESYGARLILLWYGLYTCARDEKLVTLLVALIARHATPPSLVCHEIISWHIKPRTSV